MQKIKFLFILVFVQLSAQAAKILIPMDDANQKNHLKAVVA